MFGRSLMSLVFSRTRGDIVQRYFSTTNVNRQLSDRHSPSNWEKRYLVWTGKYKSVNDVPDTVSYSEMNRCRNILRIHIATVMMIAIVLGCALMISSGRAALERGESLSEKNIAWHKEINQASKKQKE